MKLWEWVEPANSLWTSPRTTVSKNHNPTQLLTSSLSLPLASIYLGICLYRSSWGWVWVALFGKIFISTLRAKWKKIKFFAVDLIETLADNILSTKRPLSFSPPPTVALFVLCSFTFKLTRNEIEFKTLTAVLGGGRGRGLGFTGWFGSARLLLWHLISCCDCCYSCCCSSCLPVISFT